MKFSLFARSKQWLENVLGRDVIIAKATTKVFSDKSNKRCVHPL